MRPESRLPEALLQQLHQVRQRLTNVSVADGIGLALFVGSLNIAAVLLLDLLVDLPVFARVLLLASVPFVVLLILAGKILFPLMSRYRDTDLAAVVELSHPELRERLLSIVELEDAAARGEAAGSELMRRMLLQQTMEFASKHDFADVVDTRKAVRRCWLGGIGLLALMLPLVFATNAYAVLFARFLNPWGNYERLQNLVFTVDHADRVVGRGDDVQIVARPEWRFREEQLPDSVWLQWTDVTGAQQSRRMDWNDQEHIYSTLLPRVEASFDYVVSARGGRTRIHRIDVVDRPEISSFTAEMIPPAYTGRPAMHMEALLGTLQAVEQSQLDWNLAFTKQVVSAEVLWLDGEVGKKLPRDETAETVNGVPVRSRSSLNLANDRRSASMHLIAGANGPSGRFVIRVVDEFGLHARIENINRLSIQPDLAPLIDFADNEQNASARPEDFLRIPVRASDDYGLSAVELHYEFLRGGVKESGQISVPSNQLGGQDLATSIEFDLHQLKLANGMSLSLRARALDNRPVPGPNETWTGIRTLQILEDAKPYGDQTLADQQHRMDQAMDNLKSEIEKERQNARQLQAEAQSDDKRHEEWRGEGKTAALEEKIRELAQQMEKLSAVLEQQPVFQPLAEQARHIAEKELAQAAAKADETQRAPSAQKQQKLADAADRLQKAEKELAKVQEKHQELAQLQRDLLELNRLAENTEQLADQVDSLIRRRPAPQPEDAGGITPAEEFWNLDHQRLITRHQQLEKDLDKVLTNHPDLLDKARDNLKHQLAAIGEKAEQLSHQQQGLANAQQQTVQEQVKSLSELRQQQNQLQAEQRQLAESLQLPASENLDVAGSRAMQQARQALEQGNVAESGMLHQAAQEQLEQLARQLGQQAELPTSPQELLTQLTARQQQLNTAMKDLPVESTPESQQEMNRLIAEETAIQRAAAELPRTEATEAARQQLMDQAREVSRELAEQRPQEAAEQAARIVESLEQLQQALQAASEDPAQQSALESPEVLQAVQEERERTQQMARQAEQLSQQQKSLSEAMQAAAKSLDSPVQPPSPPPGQEPQSSPTDVAEQQSQLAAYSRQLGDAIRSLALENQELNRASHEFPNVARAADQQLRETKFERAAEFAQEAAEKSQKFADLLQKQQDGTVPERLQEMAKLASEQQQATAQRLQTLAASRQQQNEYLAAKQEQIKSRSGELSQKLDQFAEQLGLKQIDRASLADLSRQGSGQATQAQQAMQAADVERQAGNAGKAVDEAKRSSEALKEAANLSRQASNGGNPHQPPENHAQGEVGQQVAESAQHLNRAGEQLAGLGQPSRRSKQGQSNEGAPDEDGDEQKADDGKKSAEQGDGQQQGQKPAKSDSKEDGNPQASQSLRDAAKNMRQAAEQMGLSRDSQRTKSQNQQANGRENGDSTGIEVSDTASNGEVNLEDIDNFLGKVSDRNWGKLPGTLQTEMLESAQRPRDAAYGSLIRRYFEEISKSRPPQISDTPAQ